MSFSFQLAGSEGRAKIWIETNGRLVIHIWDYGKRKEVLDASMPWADGRCRRAAVLRRLLVSHEGV